MYKVIEWRGVGKRHQEEVLARHLKLAEARIFAQGYADRSNKAYSYEVVAPWLRWRNGLEHTDSWVFDPGGSKFVWYIEIIEEGVFEEMDFWDEDEELD